MNRQRLLAGGATVVGVTVFMLAVGAVAGGAEQTPAPAPITRPIAAPAEVLSRADATTSIEALQARLRTVPKDGSAWSSLGLLYTQQAKLSADPSFYGKADGAFARALALAPDDPVAISGQAALAAARHDFSEALTLAKRADRLNPYSAANLGVMADALGELGRYPEYLTTLQRMVDLTPGVPSYARVSYSYELRGDTKGARFALEQALGAAQRPADVAYAQQYLGELAFNEGDLATARRHVTAGLAADPTHVPLLAGRARIAAASGDTAAALRDWQDVTTRLPEPTYLIEYADLLAALGRTADAERQYAVVDATIRLFRAEGANVDLEVALYEADRGRSREALRSAGAEIARRQSVHVEDAYAWALHSAGDDATALVHARKAQRLGTRSALFAYHRGMIEKSLGQDDAARASLGRALKINPHFSPLHAPRAKAALAELGGSAAR
jgi:tetratricopeptide (TPR) repeat protein